MDVLKKIGAYLKRFLKKHDASGKLRMLFDPGVVKRYRKGQWYILIERWYLTAAIFFMEMVFKASTTGNFFPSVIAILLFSIAIGQICYLIASFSKNPKINTRIKKVFLAVFGLIFCVEYFVFREFGVFYNVKTIFAGANDVAGGFMGTVADLVFSPSGILHIVLFFLPLILYFVQACFPVDRARQIDWPEKARILANAVVAHLLALLLIAMPGGFGIAYAEQYNYPNAVTNYGLLTGIRKDLTTDTTIHFKVDPDTGELEQYDEKSVMDIDFAALADSTDREVYKELDRYVSSLTPSSKNDMTGRFAGYNLIFISAEAFCTEAILPDRMPALARMAENGIQFTDYYQFAACGTTGGECQNILGILPADGGSSMMTAAYNNNYFSLGNMLNRLGYNGWMFHNNDYLYYDRNITHFKMGYNNGFLGWGNGIEEWVPYQWPESDLDMVKGTFENLYGNAEPFNVYYMSVSGHSVYTYERSDLAPKNLQYVEDLEYSDPIKIYLANTMEFEFAMEYLIEQLEENDLADHTLIVITGDHFPYGLNDSAILGDEYLDELYGYTVTNTFERDHNVLLMWSASMEDADKLVVDDPVCSLDILPTLCNMFGVEWDSRLLPGRDVFSDATPVVFNLDYVWKTDKGSYENGRFTRTEGAEIEDEAAYVDSMNQIVSNKIRYCYGLLDNDYYRHVFGDPEDTQAVHDAAAQ